MKYLNFLILFGALLVVQGCASKKQADSGGYRILYTTDGSGKLPKWVYDIPVEEKDGKMLISGVVDIAGNQSPSRGLTAADLQARAEIAKQIKTRVAVKLQYANEGFGYDNQILSQIVSQASDATHMVNVRIVERGFAKISDVDNLGISTRFTCYSRAAIEIDELKKMIARALQDAQDQGKISEEFKQKVEKEWNQFFNNAN